jgi:hypothetical protein
MLLRNIVMPAGLADKHVTLSYYLDDMSRAFTVKTGEKHLTH